MNNGFRSFVGFFVMVSGISIAHAGYGDVSVCNGCSLVLMQGKARDLGNGHHYFFDMKNRKLTHLLASGITNPLSIQGSTALAVGTGTVTSYAITPDEQGQFNATQALYDATGTLDFSASGQVAISMSYQRMAAKLGDDFGVSPMGAGEGFVTAFDVVSTPVLKGQAINNAFSYGNDPFRFFAASLRMSLANFENVVKVSLLGTPVTVRDRIYLADNSYFDVYFDFATQTINYQPGSARDNLGNPIPENFVDAGGGPGGHQNYVYPGNANGLLQGGNQIQNLNGLGISMRLPVGVPISNGYTIACVNTPSGTSCSVTLLKR